MIYRIAGEKDVELICELRTQQLIDEGSIPRDIDAQLHAFFRQRIKDGTCIEWLAEENGKVIASAALIFYQFPPCYENPSGLRGYVAYVYTAPEYRNQGISSKLLELIKQTAAEHDCHELMLSTSEMGRNVYLRAGFHTADYWMEMEF